MSSVTAPADMELESIDHAYAAGYLDGHRDGDYTGWHRGVRQARATDLEFARAVEAEYHRRELYGEHARDLIRQLIESGEAQARRDEFDQRVRAERAERGQAA